MYDTELISVFRNNNQFFGRDFEYMILDNY